MRICVPQVRHFIRKSIPAYRISKRLPPQGCFFFNSTMSPTSSLIGISHHLFQTAIIPDCSGKVSPPADPAILHDMNPDAPPTTGRARPDHVISAFTLKLSMKNNIGIRNACCLPCFIYGGVTGGMGFEWIFRTLPVHESRNP